MSSAPGLVYNHAVRPFQRILVALARSQGDAGLLRYAAMLAGLGATAEVHCVHVTAAGGADPESVRRDLERVVQPQFSGELRDRVVCHALEGDRLDALLGFTADHRTDLVLLGHRPGRSGRRSLAKRLAMKAPCSVWMVPAGSPPAIGKILAPIDFSRRAADALDVATSLAEAAGLDECLALHVYFNEAAATYDEYDEILVEENGDAYCLFIAPIDLHGIHVKPLFIEGHSVADAIVRVAAEQGADLIVMGTRGRSRSAAVLLGSETEQTIIESPVPVLAVKHFGSHLRLLQVLRDRRLRDRGDLRFT